MLDDTNNSTPITPSNDAAKDPITGKPGAHPIGTGVGAVAAGAAAGALGGAMAGPIGAVGGAVIGAVVGGMAGKATAEAINPTVETKYWQESYSSRPYTDPKIDYVEFAPAYRYGWESFDRRGRDVQTFDSIEGELSRGWNQAKGSSSLPWDRAKPAIRDAWNRVESAARSGYSRHQ